MHKKDSLIQRLFHDLDISSHYKSLEALACSDGKEVQKKLGSHLRTKITAHINAQKRVIKLNKNGETTEYEIPEKELKNLSKDKYWGTDNCIAAFCELTKCYVHVTASHDSQHYIYSPMQNDKTDEPPQNNTIYLTNENNRHWCAGKGTSTIGDGNCLFYALAQNIRTLARREVGHKIEQYKENTYKFFENTCAQITKKHNVNINAKKYEAIIKEQADILFFINPDTINDEKKNDIRNKDEAEAFLKTLEFVYSNQPKNGS